MKRWVLLLVLSVSLVISVGAVHAGPPYTFCSPDPGRARLSPSPSAGAAKILGPLNCDRTLPTFPTGVLTFGQYRATAFPGMVPYFVIYTPQESNPKFYPQGRYNGDTCGDARGADSIGRSATGLEGFEVESYLGREHVEEDFQIILIFTAKDGPVDTRFKQWLMDGCNENKRDPNSPCKFDGFILPSTDPGPCNSPVLPSGGMTEVEFVWVHTTNTNANFPPVANDDLVKTAPGTPLTLSLTQFLGNDSDPNHDPLRIAYTFAFLPLHGTVSINNGIATYRPAPGFVGTDKGVYILSDGRGGFDSATVLLNVGTP